MRTTRVSFGAVLVMLLSAGTMGAQTFHGGLRGEVRDVNGVLPGASVTLTNEETAISRETTTNDVGQFAFTAVVPGTYTLTAAIAGYRTHESQGIRIGTQQFITLDVTLEIGVIEESITVTGESPLIETSNASTGSVLDRKVLESLPSPGRNAFLMGVTVPTLIASGDAQFNRQQDQTNASLVSLGGGPRRGNNYLLDGFPITDMRNRSVVNPTIEALEEIKVQVHTYDAEMGRTGGGVFNVTSKSGTNDFRGTGFFQTRPTALLEQNWFLKQQGVPKVDQYYRLYGSGIGGPIVRGRTFFWTAMEGYRSLSTRNGSLRYPTSLERAGDFSQSFDRNGNLIVIYDPLTTTTDPATGELVRAPFEGNRIPAGRINPVAAAIAGFIPRPDQDVSNGAPNYVRTAEIVDRADMVTGKVDHKFSDRVSLSGTYLWNRTDEPFAVFWDDNLFGSPSWKLDRKINVVVVNNSYILDDRTVVTLRGGWNRFEDNCSIPHDFDPGTLGFNQTFLNSMQFRKFPQIGMDDFGWIGGVTGNDVIGWDSRNDIEWYSWGVNGTVSRLIGRHTFKLGADFMNMGLNTQAWGQSSGRFDFTRNFTQGPNPVTPAAASGLSFADFLLGFPSSGSAPVSNPTEVFFRYYSAYIQDDFRVSSNFTLNYGLRLEHEQGLREKEDRMVVAFDQNAVSPLNGLVSLPDGRQLMGGLVYAGQNGAPRHQGDPPAVKASPRVGAVYAVSPQMVVRGGYGIFWAPWNYPFPSTTNYGQTGYTQITTLQQAFPVPVTSLHNPFPAGLESPTGNSLGLLTGVGGNIAFIDQNKKAPRVQQWSVDVQRELPGQMAVTIGYMGTAGDRLGLGGTIDTAVNINQLDPRHLALGSALLDQVPNPFFGVPGAGGLAGLATIERGQLLRPFPQFRNVNALQVTEGRSRYHALIVQLDKRLSNWWGGRFNYTLSRLMDNQFGETNFYANRPGVPLNVYDLDAEYARSIMDMPHKLVIAPIIELPFGQGRPYLNRGGVADAILGGWSFSAIGTFESGFPLAIGQSPNNSGLFGSGQRPNIVPGVDPKTSGSTTDRLGGWINPAAWEQAPAFTFGNAPRTDPRVRTPFRSNLDLVFNKDFRLGGNKRAQFRAEILNATNTPKFRGFGNTFGTAAFGRITTQAGFMRITQLSVRFLF
jgi:trimeric autotransporter adhesin